MAADASVAEQNTLNAFPNTTLIGEMASVEAEINFTQVAQPNMVGIRVFEGTGDPNGVVTGMLGDMYVDRNGGAGATLWVKESNGNYTNTGWVRK
jgi:hypothetical protein